MREVAGYWILDSYSPTSVRVDVALYAVNADGSQGAQIFSSGSVYLQHDIGYAPPYTEQREAQIVLGKQAITDMVADFLGVPASTVDIGNGFFSAEGPDGTVTVKYSDGTTAVVPAPGPEIGSVRD